MSASALKTGECEQLALVAFAEALGLHPRAKCLEATTPVKEEQEPVSTPNDDIDGDDVMVTPRSQQMSLMKQISKEKVNVTKELFTEEADGEDKGEVDEDEEKKKRKRSKDMDEGSSEGDDEESSSDSDEDDDDGDYYQQTRVTRLLKHFDFASKLGADLRDQLASKDESDKEEKETYDDWCATNDLLRPTEKTSATEKLRTQRGFQVSYKQRQKETLQSPHWFKFNKVDRKEFKIRLTTRLDKQSRQLRREMRQCKLKLDNLSEEGIKNLQAEVKRTFVRKPTYTERYQAYLNQTFPHLTNVVNARPGMSAQSAASLAAYRAQQQRMQMQRLMQQRFPPHLAHTPAAVQQRMLIAQMMQQQQRAAAAAKPTGLTMPRLNKAKPVSQEDVIDISSSDEEDDSENRAPAKVKKAAPALPSNVMDNQSVMFKCHLCGAEILFTQSTMQFIRDHFATVHGVRNVQILQNVDQNNQITFSIIEGPPVPASLPRPGPASQSRPTPAGPPRRPKGGPKVGPASAMAARAARPKATPPPGPPEVICID